MHIQHKHVFFREKRKRKYKSDSDSSSSDSSVGSDFRSSKKWRRGLKTAEACYVAYETGNHEAAFDSDASLSGDVSKKEYLKARQRAKKKVKKMDKR